MDVEAFLPIRANELTDADVARRMINYADLVEPLAAELVRRGKHERLEAVALLPRYRSIFGHAR